MYVQVCEITECIMCIPQAIVTRAQVHIGLISLQKHAGHIFCADVLDLSYNIHTYVITSDFM